VEEDRGRSAERLVTFTDAVVAIAVTLLALPLSEIPSALADAGLGAYLDEKGSSLLGFVISFFVIARLWWGHHRIFEHVVRWDGVLVRLTVLWLFTVVLIAPATALTNANVAQDHPEVIAAYIGVMTVSSALLSALAQRVSRHPELTDGHDTGAKQRSRGSVRTTIGFVVALVVGALFPAINYFALLVLAVSGQVGGLIERRRAARR
jgi:uncharacterized membrane protein